jgi:hypothetical protein
MLALPPDSRKDWSPGGNDQSGTAHLGRDIKWQLLFEALHYPE